MKLGAHADAVLRTQPLGRLVEVPAPNMKGHATGKTEKVFIELIDFLLEGVAGSESNTMPSVLDTRKMEIQMESFLYVRRQLIQVRTVHIRRCREEKFPIERDRNIFRKQNRFCTVPFEVTKQRSRCFENFLLSQQAKSIPVGETSMIHTNQFIHSPTRSAEGTGNPHCKTKRYSTQKERCMLITCLSGLLFM